MGFSYVDDCDLIQVGDEHITVLASMQQLINSWGSLVEVTVGAINTGKSLWYLIDFVWKRGKWVAEDPQVGLDLIATDCNGNRVSLNKLRCDEASEMLGVWLTPNGDKKKTINYLKVAALEWAGKMRIGNSTPEEAWVALRTNIGAKLKYPLPACTLTETECKSIMFPAIRAALPRAGIASSLSVEFRDGPVDSLGVGILSLYHFSGTSRCAILMDQLHKKTQLGHIMMGNIEDIVLEAGLFGSVWQLDTSEIGKYISKHSWMYATIAYNNEHNISLSIPHGKLDAKRTNDREIMKCALDFCDKQSDLKAINRVRMLHQVVSLADISSADGSGLEIKYLKSFQIKAHRNTHNWPSKHHIKSSDFTAWCKLMKWIFPVANHKLQDRLGK